MKSTKTTSPNTQPMNGQMSWLEKVNAWQNDPVMKMIQPKGMPQLYGNEDFEIGESTIHLITLGILIYGLEFHFAAGTGYRVFGNLNLYFSDDPTEYVSPDVMVVKPKRTLPANLSSYWIGKEGPKPLMVGEVLSFRTWQQGDTNYKPKLYSDLGVEEYVLVDVTGEMLEKRLLLLRRQPNGSWCHEQDADGGITSHLGFRIVIDDDGQLRIINAKTGKRYARPSEAQAEADGRQRAENRVRELQEELARLRSAAAHEMKGNERKRKK